MSSNEIIRSLLDVDWYKFTMGNFAYTYFGNVPVTYGFRCRTQGANLQIIPEEELREQLGHVRSLRFSKDELEFLSESGLFSPQYLGFLRDLRLPEVEISKWEKIGYVISVSGRWPEAMHWETMILSIVNELYYKHFMKAEGISPSAVLREGQRRLREKIERLRKFPEILFSEFGTRRRFSFSWQEEVLRTVSEQIPRQVVGTSNAELARRQHLRPIGTMAHELFMVGACSVSDLDSSVRESQAMIIDRWWELYGKDLSIALPDTFGTSAFLRSMSPDMARKWKGMRQDSGDPRLFIQKLLKWYEGQGIDPRTKVCVPSDGLDLEKMISLHDEFSREINLMFGWGTNLTNDLGLDPLSLVVKIVRANGRPAVKLSDNPAKAIGDASEVDRYKRVFDYSSGPAEECRY